MAKRKTYRASFKSKVAISAIQGDMAIAELASKYGVDPAMVTKWKKQAVDGMTETFSTAAVLPVMPLMTPGSMSFTPRLAS